MGFAKASSRAAAVCAAGALALAGCGGEDEPAETSSSTVMPIDPSESTSATPTSDRPGIPAEATKNTKAGAAAFLQYYWATLDKAYMTGDVSTLEEIMSASCDVCQEEIIEGVEIETKLGTRRTDAKSKATNVKATKTDGGYQVSGTILSEEHHEIRKGGKKGRTAPPQEVDSVVELAWVDGGWVITSYKTPVVRPRSTS